MSMKSSAAPTLRFAVSGYYGCGNAGDEAVLAGIAASFARQAGGLVRLTVLSQNPDVTTRLHGLEAVDRMNMAQVRAILRDSDLLLSGGGSLLQDTTSARSLLYYLWIARMARRAGKPVMFYAQGMGPLHRPISRLLVRLTANRAAFLTVRDEPSAQLLKAIGVTNPRLEVTADPAFALTPAPEETVRRFYDRRAFSRTKTRPSLPLLCVPGVAAGYPHWKSTSACSPNWKDRRARRSFSCPCTPGKMLLLLSMSRSGRAMPTRFR